MKKNKLVLLFVLVCLALLVVGCGTEPEDNKENENIPPEVIVEKGEPVFAINQTDISLCVCDSYKLVATLQNVDNGSVTWSVDGNADTNCLALDSNGLDCVVTAVKSGSARVICSTVIEGKTYFKSVNVNIYEANTISFIAKDNISYDNNGYAVALSTIETDNADEVTNIKPSFSVYNSNKVLSNVAFSWKTENSAIADVSNGSIFSVAEGETDVVGTCTVGGKNYQLTIHVTVYRPVINLASHYTIEVENLSTIQVNDQISGTAKCVTLNGVQCGSYSSQYKTISFTKSLMPTSAKLLGDDSSLVIETDKASYCYTVDAYTMIINTKEEFDEMAVVSKSCATENYFWDGYFVLGNDISYNDTYSAPLADYWSLISAIGDYWFNGGLYGFKGHFDGKGYNVEGVAIDNGANMGSIFGITNSDGVIENVSFTKAVIAINSSLVSCAGGGTFKNIYVQVDSIGKGAQHIEPSGSINSYCGVFISFKEPTTTANVSNCVVNLANAELYNTEYLRAVGSDLLSIKNTILICDNKDVSAHSNANLVYNNFQEFVTDKAGQQKYSKFDDTMWAVESKVCVSEHLYQLNKDTDVTIQNKESQLLAGTSYNLSINTSYYYVTLDSSYVSYDNGLIKVSSECPNNYNCSVKITSLFDETVSDTMNVTVYTLPSSSYVDLRESGNVAYYDLNDKCMYYAKLKDTIATESILYVSTLDGSPICTTDGEYGEILVVTSSKAYLINYQAVMKVISKKEDLHYVRRDYTVSSYGNAGCYDSMITGTYVLVNDIDCTGLVLENSGHYWENSRGFAGTFEGNGYTISNLNVPQNGLFGTVAYATIQNVNFTHLSIMKGSLSGAYGCLLGNSIFNSVINNINVQVDYKYDNGDAWSSSGILYYEYSFDSTFSNITIDMRTVGSFTFALCNTFDNGVVPYRSVSKSQFSNIKVLVNNLSDCKAIAYKAPNGEAITSLSGVVVTTTAD